MVWSDQSQFPFYVIDNNGNTILTIDETGLHLVGPLGEIDGIISGSGYPTFNFHNAGAAFDHGELGFLPIGGGGGQNAIRLAIWNDATNTIIGQLQIDSQGNVYLYGNMDETLQSDTNLRLLRTNGPSVTLGGAAVVFAGPGSPATTVEYNDGQAAFLVSSGTNGAGWTGVTFQNGWSNFGTGYSTCAYGLTPAGNLRLRGLALGGTKTDGTVIASLPVGFRPATDKIVPVATGTSGAVLPSLRIRSSTGNIECWGQSASTNGLHSWDGLEIDRF